MPAISPARLRPCVLSECEGLCCHDGGWLLAAEVQPLRRLVRRRRAELPGLPDRFLEPGPAGTARTAVRPHRYRQPLPPHFPATRCVFAEADARCGLQRLAEGDGLHPWSYKPRACWMHPLRDGAAGPLPPPADPRDDWDRDEAYPGFVTSTPCGRHHDDGAPWESVLAAELAYWRAGPAPGEGG